MSAYWYMHEDGKSNWPGFNVINQQIGKAE